MHWIRGHRIGRGSSATVSLGTAPHSGEVFAVKSIELSRSEFLQREQRIHSLMKCPEIVSYMGFDITDENGKPMYNLFMEYVSGGTLSDAIQKHGACRDESIIRSHTRSILRGLEYLHSHGLVHCDIKGRNVLLGDDGAKIADLGCARWVHEGTTKAISGTPVFMAPEVARGEEQGCPADVWALGCTVIEMAAGRPPWGNIVDPASVLYRIAFSHEVPEVPSFLSVQAKDFLSKCIVRDPKKRGTVTQLLEHPFLDEPNSYPKQIQGKTWDSPTGVLDQDIWDSVEDSEMLCESSRACSSDLPMERIRRLSGRTSSSSPRLPSWTWDDNWLTVRSSGIEDRNHKMISADGECATTSGSISTSINSAKDLLESSVYGPVNNTKYSSDTSSSRRFVMDCKCSKEGSQFCEIQTEFRFPSIRMQLKS